MAHSHTSAPAIASADAHFSVLPKVAHGIVPAHVQRALQAQLSELILPHAVVVHKGYIMPCMSSTASVQQAQKTFLVGQPAKPVVVAASTD